MPVNITSKWNVQVKKHTDSRLSVYEPILGRWPGRLGDYSGNVQNPNYPTGYVYVRGLKGDLMTMWNEHAPNVWDLPIIYGYESTEPKLLQVLYQWTSYDQQPYASLPPHAPSHELGGSDTVWVYGAQLVPFDVLAAGGLTVSILPGIANYGSFQFIQLLSQSIDLTSHVPGAGLGARMVLLAIHSDGSVAVTDGALVDSPEQLTLASIPAPSNQNDLPLAAVRLYDGQTVIQQTIGYTDIFDLRSLVSGGSSVWGRLTGYLNDQADLMLRLAQAAHTHELFRWVADGVATAFNLPDYAGRLTGVFDNGSFVDTNLVDLSADGGQVVFSVAPTSTHIIVAEYILAQR